MHVTWFIYSTIEFKGPKSIMSSPDRVHRIATGDSRSPEVKIPTAMKMMPAMIIAAARKKVTERKLLPSCELLPFLRQWFSARNDGVPFTHECSRVMGSQHTQTRFR